MSYMCKLLLPSNLRAHKKDDGVRLVTTLKTNINKKQLHLSNSLLFLAFISVYI